MAIEDDIFKEEANIRQLQSDLKNINLPRRNIAWQHNNRGIASRNITQRVLITKRARLKIDSKIKQSQSRLSLFRSSILGV